MLSPKRTKFRKMHKGRIKGLAKGGTDLNFGSFGLKATLSLPSRPKCGWVKVKVRLNTGPLRSSRAA